VSDNGTPAQIVSMYNNTKITGGMGSTTTYGTHVPMIAYCPGSITPGICTSFIDLTDFLPSITGLANTTIPASYGTADGISFRNQLFESSFAGRNYLYTYFFPHPEFPATLQRTYVQDSMYKYYSNGYGFYDIVKDPYELSKINPSTLTQDQNWIITGFRKVIDSIHP
jgi:arylsulfatase A-like enzyme